MSTILLPFDGSASARHGVQHVIDASRKDPDLQVHVLNVQSPLPGHVANHVGRQACTDFHREQAVPVLAGASRSLDAAGVRHTVHWEVGDRAASSERLAPASTGTACSRWKSVHAWRPTWFATWPGRGDWTFSTWTCRSGSFRDASMTCCTPCRALADPSNGKRMVDMVRAPSATSPWGEI